MTTLVLSPRHSEDSNAIEQAAIRAGWRIHRPDGWRIPQDMAADKALAFYGEALFVRVIADQLGYVLLEASHEWLANLPERYLQRHIEAMTLEDAYKSHRPAFIKPAGDKAFTSRVYMSGSELAADTHDLVGTIHVLISEPVEWQIECRSFVMDRQVRSIATYVHEGSIARSDDGAWKRFPKLEHEAEQFAMQVVGNAAVDCPPAFVLDVGMIRSRGWAVLEANPAWASGIYGNDADRVLPVIERACIHPERLTDKDQQWLSQWESWEPE